MATFVLVHPACFGGWCWKKVTPILRGRGHEVFTPTLTGLGERAHLAGLRLMSRTSRVSLNLKTSIRSFSSETVPAE